MDDTTTNADQSTLPPGKVTPDGAAPERPEVAATSVITGVAATVEARFLRGPEPTGGN